MEPSFEIDLIALKYIREETLTPDETVILHTWMNAAPGREAMLESIKNGDEDTLANLRRLHAIGQEVNSQKAVSRLQQEGYFQALDSSVPILVAQQVSSGRSIRRWLAAASVIVLLGVASWWIMSQRPAPAASIKPAAVATDVRPGGNKAVLTLADGRQIALDSVANGVIAAQQNATVSKSAAGQLAYNNSNTPAGSAMPVIYNVLSTPRANQFSLTLADGTKVWLNNASTLRYPVPFTGADRTVELTGEGYFEVSKDAAHPFHVIVHGATNHTSTIEVLGTAFNVMAYGDEPDELTTLLSGSIRFSDASHSTLLRPAQQSVLDDKGDLHVSSHVDVQEVIAWKSGYFHFDNSSLEETMRQLARWYDVDIRYEGQATSEPFVGHGRIQRDLPLSAVMKGLEDDHIKFHLQGKTLIVTQH